MLYPKVYTCPLTVNNTLWLSPAAIWPINSSTAISSNVFDFPTLWAVWPYTFKPEDNTLPLDVNNNEWFFPKDISITSFTYGNIVGYLTFSYVLVPNSPLAFKPHTYT